MTVASKPKLKSRVVKVLLDHRSGFLAQSLRVAVWMRRRPSGVGGGGDGRCLSWQKAAHQHLPEVAEHTLETVEMPQGE